jgi:aryl-alcohol dehydrogenase-like predicted oxidoreductase
VRYREVGGVRVSVVGLGTWQFGGREWGYGADWARRESGAIVTRALELGVNLIDTAELYGFGRSERLVGAAIRDRRDAAFLATKIAPFLPFEPVVSQRAAGSARRLGVERIDLYQAHWWNPVFGQSSLIRALARLVGDGRVGNVGVSNYSLARWQEAEELLGGPVLSNQVEFSLVHRSAEEELVPWAQQHDRLIIAYSPLAQGLLGGGYSPQHRPGGMRRWKPVFLPDNLDRASVLLSTLGRVASEHDATPAQVALAWLLRRPNVVVIPGASSVAQLEANVAAAELDLTADEDLELTADASAFTPEGGLRAAVDVVRSFRG